MVTQANEMDNKAVQNPKLGFKCLHYVVSESCGTLDVKISKKTQETVIFMLKTIDGTAKANKKYSPIEEMITMQANQMEHIVSLKIVDDDEYNEDLDFLIEICSEEGKRLEGDDTQSRITIKDEDLPGTICFEKRKVTVRKMDKYAYIQLTRKDGAAGDISCYCKTEVCTKEVNNQAEEFTDFMPFNDPIHFKHQETYKLIKVELINDETMKNDADKGTPVDTEEK